MTRVERSREKAQYWRSVLEEHRRSGQQDGEFCRDRGVGVHTLRAWRYRFARDAARKGRSTSRRQPRIPATIDFLPVRVGSAVAPPPVLQAAMSVTTSRSGVELVLAHDRVVRVERGFDEETFLRIVSVLERR